MDYDKIEQGLISSVSEDDPHKVSKQLQIKQWTHLYGKSLLGFSLARSLNFVKQIISDEDCWEEVNTIEGVKLNRYKVGNKLLAPTTPGGEENPFNNMKKYKIACWCCFEDKIRELWDEAQSNFTGRPPILKLLNGIYAREGILVAYWTHYITGHMDQFKAKFQVTGDNNDLHGFKSAIEGKHAEALEYFWNKLQVVLLQEENDALLMDVATYYNVFIGRANADMISFAINHLDKCKYRELLSKDFDQSNHYSTLSILRASYLFDCAEALFSCLIPTDITNNVYYIEIYATLNTVVSVPDNPHLINAGCKMLSTMWHMEGFEEHRQYFIKKLSNGASAGIAIAELVQIGRESDTLSEIVNALNVEQVKNLYQSKSWVYEILKLANLFNHDVMEHLVYVEQDSTPILGQQENSMMF